MMPSKRTPEKEAWRNMHMRCYNPRAVNYPLYGGRGISVCAEWFSFDQFLADMGPRPAGLTLDRIDSNGDYTPTNCRWASRITQQRNTSRNVFLDINGRRATVAEWAAVSGLNVKTLRKRIQSGWPTDRLLEGKRQA
jgi:hypothetical protein